jgi:hypothetical protein
MKRTMVLKISFCLAIAWTVCFFGISGADAGVAAIKPADACQLLDSISLSTFGWITYSDTESKCSSRSIQIGSGNPFKNSLEFHVEGTGQTVHQLKLIVNVLNPDESDKAHDALKTAAQHLIMKLTNKPAPENLLKAILDGKNISSKTGDFMVDVIRKEWVMNTDWGTTACHGITLVIQ